MHYYLMLDWPGNAVRKYYKENLKDLLPKVTSYYGIYKCNINKY